MDNQIIKKNNLNNKIKNKTVNYRCACKIFFITEDKINVLYPCCHMYHDRCIKNCIDGDKINCIFCKENQKIILDENTICKNKKYNQIKININAVKLNESAKINYIKLPIASINFFALINKLISATTLNEIDIFVEYFLKICNIKINILDNTKNNKIKMTNKISWVNKNDNNAKKIIIANHTTIFDSLIIYYLFRCGFICSDFINKYDIGRILVAKCNVLIFKRGVDTNVVNKIKDYLNDMKQIVIFPEGTYGNNSILEFRTGAFHVGEIICPIVIKYNPFIYDNNMSKFIAKAITSQKINVDVYINDFYYPPFDNEKIQNIRKYMANIGNFSISNVSNRDISD